MHIYSWIAQTKNENICVLSKIQFSSLFATNYVFEYFHNCCFLKINNINFPQKPTSAKRLSNSLLVARIK